MERYYWPKEDDKNAICDIYFSKTKKKQSKSEQNMECGRAIHLEGTECDNCEDK